MNRILYEVTRTSGYKIASGITVVSGMVAQLSTADTTGETITLANSYGPYRGIFLETNVASGTGLNQRDETSGSSRLSVASGHGTEILIWDDGRGCPYNPSDNYTINVPLSCDANGRVTTTFAAAGITNTVGWVTKVPSSSTDSLGIKLNI